VARLALEPACEDGFESLEPFRSPQVERVIVQQGLDSPCAALHQAAQGRLWEQILVTLEETILGFVIGVVLER
jgi:ABC-type nitrate/sulfonate/bicarbonate transport system permease component